MAGKSIARFLPGNHWMFRRPKQRQLIADMRRAYGDACWQCGHLMNFHSMAVRKRATVEHLLAKTHGGTSAWENVRLCHVGCNRHLGTHSPEHKRRMRLALAKETVPEFVERGG